MVHLTVALVAFLGVLLGGLLRVGAGLVAAGLLAGGLGLSVMRMVRNRRRPR